MERETWNTKLRCNMKKVIMGNHAASYAAKLCRVQVISAYPITPQTQVVEMLSEMCANGELQAKFIPVESEHSAMAAVIGASATGVRAFTATSSHGLMLMHEMVHWAAGSRLPIVMAEINRAVGPGWNIWTDQNDSLAQRDTGWMQIYVESNQEVLDTIIQGYKIAETVLMPLMVVLDAFYLSHTYEPADIPEQEQVDAYLPPYRPQYKLDVNDPHAFNGLAMPDVYMEMRWKMQAALEQAKSVAAEADAEFGRQFGRSYGLVEGYRLADADVALVTSGTATSTAREVIDDLRAAGHKIGLLKMRLFRPFPSELVREKLAGVRKVAVLDRNIGFGMGGIFAQEIKAALCNEAPSHLTPRNGGCDGASQPSRPIVFDYVAGLGGRDITPQTIAEIVQHTLAHAQPEVETMWIGLKR